MSESARAPHDGACTHWSLASAEGTFDWGKCLDCGTRAFVFPGEDGERTVLFSTMPCDCCLETVRRDPGATAFVRMPKGAPS